MRPLLHGYHLTAASAALAVGAQFLSGDASAHIELQSPLNRYSNIKVGDNKACPCGSGTTSRSCRKPEELSDPDRSVDRATTFAPGDTITVHFDEYVGHSGRYRIAFDPDGADLDDFNQNILMDEPDPAGSVGNLGRGSIWEFAVTLPDMTCDNCTLQLIQVMDGNTTDPVLNPVDRGGTYFQCADLILRDGTPPGGLAPASPTDHPGQRGRPNPIPAARASSTEMVAGGAPVNGDGSSRSTTTVSTSTPDDSAIALPMDSASEDGGGCSLVSRVRPSNAWPALGELSSLLLAAGLRAKRRRRR